jgi:hypothetical protein
LTEIRLISPASSHLQPLLGASDNLAISVTYESNSGINAAYEALTSNFQIRLDLFDRFGIYGRLNWQDNNAPAYVLTQTLTDLVGGVDYHWRWLRTGAEYEDFDSSYSQYQAFRLFQNADFNVGPRSTLGLSLDETFYHYTQNGDQTEYRFVARYSVQLWSSLSCFLQGGASWEKVFGSDDVQGSAQTGLNWAVGRLSVRLGYEYNTQSTQSGAFNETWDKHRVFAYLKRTF